MAAILMLFIAAVFVLFMQAGFLFLAPLPFGAPLAIADKVRTEVTVSIQPLYEQYRDREGTRIEDQRSDRIEHARSGSRRDTRFGVEDTPNRLP